MTGICALELQDSALAIARDGVVLSVAASHAAGDVTSRHLAQLFCGELLPRPLERAEAELRARLAADSVDARMPLWCVTPALAEAASLGGVLSLVRRAGAGVCAFIDGATLSASTLALERDALVFEVGLHHLAVASVACGGVARKRRSLVSMHGGWVALSRAWLDLIRAATVNRTRIDPLRNATTERSLLEALPRLAREACERGTVSVGVQAGAQTADIELTHDQLLAAADPVLGELARLAGQLHVPGVMADVIAPRAFATLPGFAGLLDRAAGGARRILLEDGYAAAAASLLPADIPAKDAVPYLRRIAAAVQAPLRALVTERAPGSADISRPASHIIWEARAVSLGGTAVVVGRGTTPGLDIALPEDSAGVSRRHCTFVSREGEVALIDHSRFGTFVNGRRVIERAAIRAGDRVRIGEPGFELDVVAVDST